MAKAHTKLELDEEQAMPEVVPESASQVAVIDQEAIATAQRAVAMAKEEQDAVMQPFINWMVERADTGDEDQYAIMAAIMKEMMEAENPAELLKERSTIKARETIGVPLLLHGFEIREGDYEDSMFQHYAAMTVSRPGSDVTRVCVCGATKILMKLYLLDRMDTWPIAFYFTEKVKKGKGILDMIAV